jgi:Tol biopolymer transport system component
VPEIFAPGVVSTEAHELSYCFSPDGKYLFFTSGERGQGDIYWVDASVLKR